MAQRINQNNSLGVDNTTSGVSSTIRIVRVYDVILDNTHPLYLGEDSIGVIYYGDLNLKIDPSDVNAIRGLNKATPIFPYISYIPTLQELVKIEEYTSNEIYSDLRGISEKKKAYYHPPINLFNTPTQNALPASGKVEFELGEYFKESESKKLQRFEGDLIIEGRFGNGIRFGSSTPKGKNNWSNNDSLGEPITIISNGVDNPGGDALLEDINSTKSIVVMTSNQNIDNFIPVSLNTKSLGTEFKVTTKTRTLIEDTPEFTGIQDDIDALEFQSELVFDLVDKSPPSPATEPEPFSAEDDVFFNLLEDQIEEGYVKLIYNFEYIDANYGAAPRPDDFEAWEEEDEIINNVTYGEQLPIAQVPKKVKYTPVYINESRKWTKIDYNSLAKKINLFAREYNISIRRSILAVAINEQGGGGVVGGYNFNHYGVMADLGNWTNGDVYSNGSVAATEGAGGQGIRTDKIRYFMSFPNEKNGILFIAEALTRKGFNDIRNGDQLADKYVRKWLAPADPDGVIRTSGNKYQKLFQQTNDLIINNSFT